MVKHVNKNKSPKLIQEIKRNAEKDERKAPKSTCKHKTVADALNEKGK